MEPVSTSGLTAILKFYGAAIVVTLAVTLTCTPRSAHEWAVGLTCTVVSSLVGGSLIIVKWGHSRMDSCFVCDISGWALVRWTF